MELAVTSGKSITEHVVVSGPKFMMRPSCKISGLDFNDVKFRENDYIS